MFKSHVKRWMMVTDIKDIYHQNLSSLSTYRYPKGYLYKYADCKCGNEVISGTSVLGNEHDEMVFTTYFKELF